jgi:hypothetical protein
VGFVWGSGNYGNYIDIKDIGEDIRKDTMPKGIYKRTEETKRILSKSKKGHIGYWKGKHHYEETKRKISESLIGKILSKKTKMKMSEVHQGRHRSEETRKKISKSHKGMKSSKETKKKMSIKRKGKKPTLGKHHSEEARKKMSETHSGEKFSKKRRQKISEALKGMMPTNNQKLGKWNNILRGYYNINGKEIFFRSKWEANYSLYLDFLIKQKQIKKWEYEPDVFMFKKIKLGTRSYRPDFKIYNNDDSIEYHEVKGYMTPGSKTKIKRMAKYYPNIKLIIIDKDIYKDIKIKVGKMLKFY